MEERQVLITNCFLLLCNNSIVANNNSLFCKILLITLRQIEILVANPHDAFAGVDILPFTSNTPLADLKADLLLKLSSCYMNSENYQESIQLAQQCMKESTKTSNKVLEIQSCMILAQATEKERDYHNSILYNCQLLKAGRSLNADEIQKVEWNNHLQCQIILNLSTCYDSLGEVNYALHYAKEYLKTVKYISQEDVINIYSFLGKLQRSCKEFTSALHSHELELAICKKYKDRIGMAKAYGNIGLVYAASGNKMHANVFLNQELKMARSMGNTEIEMISLRDISEAKMQLGEIGPAIAYYKKLYTLAREVYNWKMQCIAYVGIGKLYQLQGTLNFSRHYLEQGMERAKDLGMKAEAIDAEMHLAQVLKRLDYYEDARRHYKKVILYLENSLDTLHHFEILVNSTIIEDLHRCYKDLQEVLVKLDCWKEAFEIAELCHSRTLYNVLKRRKGNGTRSTYSQPPLALTDISKILEKFPKNTTVLCYSLTSSGFLLWLLKPGKGLTKFVMQNVLASCPIEQLVRDCMRQLGISKKGNRCCYEAQYKQKITYKCTGESIVDDAGISQAPSASCRVADCTLHILPKTSKTKMPLAQHLSDLPCRERTNVLADSRHTSGINEVFPKQATDLLSGENRRRIISDEPFDGKSQARPNTGLSEKAFDSDSKEQDSSSDAASAAHMNATTQIPDDMPCDVPVGEALHSEDNENSRHTCCTEADNEMKSKDELLRELFKLLLGKVEHVLQPTSGDDQLVFIPDGILNMVPFHLLIDKTGKALSHKFLVSLLPCFALLAVNPKKDDKVRGTALVYGNPSLKHAGFHNMTGDAVSCETEEEEEEVQRVSKMLGVKCYSGKIATKASFLKLASSQEIIHIASFGSISKGYLLFAPNPHRECKVAEPSSYVFDSNDLAQLSLSSKIVILSSCHQCPHGVAESSNVELTLATGFLAAGAMSVVVFLYAVPSKVQGMIVHKLYRSLEKVNKH